MGNVMSRRQSLIFAIIFSLVIVATFVLGRFVFDIDLSIYEERLQSLRGSIWGLPVVIGIFTAASFFGLPQWALITVSVVAFGPAIGAVYSWLATLFSAMVNFWLADLLGRERLSRLTGPRLGNVLDRIKRNGLLWSFVVRLVPTGPFILVNMAAGVSSITTRSFLIGTALGIIPKILVVALLAKGVFAGLDGRMMSLVFILLAVAAIGLTFWLQKRFGAPKPKA
jgi:uncharacterized membrane protein YdjX (TVP38/TMEM64 family)